MLGVVSAHRLRGKGASAASIQSSAPTGGPAPVDPTLNLAYHGGPVMHTNTAYAIYWLPSGWTFSTPYEGTANGFFANVAAADGNPGNVYSTDSQYADGTGAANYSSKFGGGYTDTSTGIVDDCSGEYSATPVGVVACVTDADIQSELSSALEHTNWTPSATSVFFVFTPQGVGSCFDASSGDCAYTNYCGYHSAFTDSQNRTVLYAVIPYSDGASVGAAGACDAGVHPDTDLATDAMLNIVSREHNDAITDPLGTAWSDPAGNEIADKCAWNFGSPLGSTPSGAFNQAIGNGRYYLQEEWSNASSSCVQNYYGFPPTITGFSPTAATAGSSVTITGTNLAGATRITFAGSTAGGFTVVSPTSIRVPVPASAASGPIAITTPAGVATSSATFSITPSISSFTPAGGQSGRTVSIYGDNFTAATAVKFGGVDAASFTVNTPNWISAVASSADVSGQISVTTPGGTGLSAGVYSIVPSVGVMTPSSGPAGTVVTISGANFTGTSSVVFAGGASASFTITSPTSLSVTVPATAGIGQIAVKTAGGSSLTPAVFLVSPSTTSFSPAQGIAASTVTITGTNFDGASAVQFNGTAAAGFQVKSATTITATVPPTATSGPISVTTRGGSSGYGDFTVIPVVMRLAPDASAAGGVVTIYGTNLSGVDEVEVDGEATNAYNVLSATSMQATISDQNDSGPISVQTPDAASADGPALLVRPTIDGLSNASGVSGSTVTISGSNLGTASAVLIGGVAATDVTPDSENSVTATVPARAKSGSVSVTTSGGTTTSPMTFSVLPQITSFSPPSGRQGTIVTINGSGLGNLIAIKFNGIASKFKTISAVQVTATVPGTAKTGLITVSNASGTAGSATAFTLTPTPAAGHAAKAKAKAKTKVKAAKRK